MTIHVVKRCDFIYKVYVVIVSQNKPINFYHRVQKASLIITKLYDMILTLVKCLHLQWKKWKCEDFVLNFITLYVYKVRYSYDEFPSGQIWKFLIKCANH